MKLIVGLGNPGDEYKKTRHNIGFMIVDEYLGDIKYKEKYNGLYYISEINGEKVLFLKPQTYMNNSGICVRKFVDFYKIKHCDIMVVQDDLDLDLGIIKYKINSSSGGHNGIKSIIENLNGNDFFRMKVGISKNNNDIIDYVLGNMNNSEISKISFEKAKKSIEDFIIYDYNYVMNKFNGQ